MNLSQFQQAAGHGRGLDAGLLHPPLRADKRETSAWLKFTHEGAGARTHGYAITTSVSPDTDLKHLCQRQRLSASLPRQWPPRPS